MLKPSDPKQLALDLLSRSICAVQCSAVVWDHYGIISWGWNSSGADGMGEHAEIAAIRRANKLRLAGANIAVAGRRKRNGKLIIALPCADCTARIVKRKLEAAWVQTHLGLWQKVNL